LINAAREPEIVDLAELLIKMGARISGAGSDTLRIEGVSALHAAEHRIIPDRIEAGTYLIAGLISGGQVRVEQVSPPHLSALIDKLREIGVEPRSGEDWAETGAHSKLQAADLRTAPYPGFPTDLQAQFMALMTQAHGTSVITETIFENRFMHAAELRRMGARITTEGRRAVVQGPTPLSGGRNHRRPRLPPRPRLRRHGRQAATARRRRHPHPRLISPGFGPPIRLLGPESGGMGGRRAPMDDQPLTDRHLAAAHSHLEKPPR
jgi:hypothetical protein